MPGIRISRCLDLDLVDFFTDLVSQKFAGAVLGVGHAVENVDDAVALVVIDAGC